MSILLKLSYSTPPTNALCVSPVSALADMTPSWDLLIHLFKTELQCTEVSIQAADIATSTDSLEFRGQSSVSQQSWH